MRGPRRAAYGALIRRSLATCRKTMYALRMMSGMSFPGGAVWTVTIRSVGDGTFDVAARISRGPSAARSGRRARYVAPPHQPGAPNRQGWSDVASSRDAVLAASRRGY